MRPLKPAVIQVKIVVEARNEAEAAYAAGLQAAAILGPDVYPDRTSSELGEPSDVHGLAFFTVTLDFKP